MSRTEAVLRLYRAAREFTRRVTGVETLEEAALAYAKELGWVEAREMLTVDKPRVVADADLRALHTRISELQSVLRDLLASGDPAPVDTYVSTAAYERAREVLG